MNGASGEPITRPSSWFSITIVTTCERADAGTVAGKLGGGSLPPPHPARATSAASAATIALRIASRLALGGCLPVRPFRQASGMSGKVGPVRFLWICLVAALLAAAGCGSHHAEPARPRATASPEATAAPAAATPASPRLRVRSDGRLPAPVQLPGMARTSDGRILAVGGLDAADASTATVTQLAPGRAR